MHLDLAVRSADFHLGFAWQGQADVQEFPRGDGRAAFLFERGLDLGDQLDLKIRGCKRQLPVLGDQQQMTQCGDGLLAFHGADDLTQGCEQVFAGNR